MSSFYKQETQVITQEQSPQKYVVNLDKKII